MKLSPCLIFVTLLFFTILGEMIADMFSVLSSLSQVVFSGIEFMRLQQKADEAQRKEDDRLGAVTYTN